MNKPTAWKVIETDDEGSFTTFTEVEPVWTDNAIPLYTHPAKEKGLPRSNPLPMNQAYLTRSDNYTPIAWSCWSEGMQAAIITTTEPDMYGWQSIIPLFSHPAELTDEEIFSEMLELVIRYRNETPLGNQPHMIAHVADDVIARAILRKAQEK